MKNVALPVPLLCLLLSLPAWPVVAHSAPVAVTSANIRELLESGNRKVSAANLRLEAAERREGSFVRSFLPEIDAFGAQENFRKGPLGRRTQPAYGVAANMNLFNGGRDWLEGRSRALETDQRRFGGQRLFAEEVERARNTYWGIRYLQERTVLLKSTLEVNQKNLEAARRRIRSGVATDSDRFEFEMKDVELRRDLAETEVKAATQVQLLSLQLGLEPAGLSFPEPLTHDHSYETVLAHASSDHEFLFKENELRAEQLGLHASSASRAWWPRLDAYAGYYQFNQREEAEFARAEDRRESVVGLKLSIRLPTGLESVREAGALGKESAAARALADFERKEVEVHIAAEKAELKLLHAQVHEAEENIRRAEGYYRITQSEYARGVKNSPDVLGAAQKLFDMQHKRIEIVRDFQVAKAHVLSKIGR